MASTGGKQGCSQFCSASEGFAFKAVDLLLSALSFDRAALGCGSQTLRWPSMAPTSPYSRPHAARSRTLPGVACVVSRIWQE